MGVIQNINYEDFKQIQRVAGVGSWEYDIISNRNYWFEETYKIYGIEDRSAVATNEGFLKFVHPEDIEIIKKIAEDPPIGPFDTQFRIIRASLFIWNNSGYNRKS